MITNSFINRFPTGEVRVTPAAYFALSHTEIVIGLIRHIDCDWGELDEQDWRQNDAALTNGSRLLSRYVTPGGKVFWIITEHDRSATTILLPNDN
jgi:hypothetical protein